MISANIDFFGECVLACDARCDKAWGVNNRPGAQLSEDPDDYISYSDGETGDAPANPGTYEGSHGKPQRPDQRLNKWCARECERSVIVEPGSDIELPDLSVRMHNIPVRPE